VLEIDNGTGGQYRDLQLRSINPASGNVGIGTVDPFGGKLIIASGNVGIGSLTPGKSLDVQGTIRFSNLIGNISVYDNGNSSTSKTVDWNNGNRQKDHHDRQLYVHLYSTDGESWPTFP